MGQIRRCGSTSGRSPSPDAGPEQAEQAVASVRERLHLLRATRLTERATAGERR
jgi:hypothetical protein